MTDSDLLLRLDRLDTASLCDAGKSVRVFPSDIRPVVAGTRMIGRALTADSGGDLMSVLGALHRGGPGDILVVATAGARHAVAGELFATEAVRRGLAGIVIDGYCRDLATLMRLPLPIFARGATPRAGGAQAAPAVNVTLHIGEITVEPGDIVLGDDDGIIAGTEAELSAALGEAEDIHRREEALRARMEQGASLFDTLNFVDHATRRQRGEPSTLTFS
jgi:4-hydroxy-4-methyl-2-oxoglutarate aldolase